VLPFHESFVVSKHDASLFHQQQQHQASKQAGTREVKNNQSEDKNLLLSAAADKNEISKQLSELVCSSKRAN